MQFLHTVIYNLCPQPLFIKPHASSLLVSAFDAAHHQLGSRLGLDAPIRLALHTF